MNNLIKFPGFSTPDPAYELTKEEARQLAERLKPLNDFVTRLKNRTDRDVQKYAKLRRMVVEVENALQRLNVHLHYEQSGWSHRE